MKEHLTLYIIFYTAKLAKLAKLDPSQLHRQIGLTLPKANGVYSRACRDRSGFGQYARHRTELAR